MPEQAIANATQSIVDVGVIGAVCILLMGALVWTVRTWRKEVKDERDAHQVTRNAHLADVRDMAKLSESIRDQQKATESAITSVLEFVKNERRA
jgi:hypothetical protein